MRRIEKECWVIKSEGEVYLVTNKEHEIGGWCLVSGILNKVVSTDEMIEISSRDMVTESNAEFINKTRITKGMRPVHIGEFSVMTFSISKSMVESIVATTNKELIEGGVLSIPDEDIDMLESNPTFIVNFNIIEVGTCGCPCHQGYEFLPKKANAL